MTNQDTALEVAVETVETPQETPAASPDVEAEPTQDVNDEAEAESKGDEPVEETTEDKLARLERLEEKSQAAQKKIKAQRKAYASLQKAAQEKDAKLQEFMTQQQSAESQAPEKPIVDNFETYQEYENAQEKYIDELADYKAKTRYQQEREEQLQKEAEMTRIQAQQERAQQYEAQKKAFIEVAPDYVESEAEVNDYLTEAQKTTDPYVQGAIVDQTYGHDDVSAPELMHYFGANNGERLAELDAISKLTPTRAAVEIYKIQEKLKSHPKKREVSEPKPKPPSRVKGGSKAASNNLGQGDVLKNLGLK